MLTRIIRALCFVVATGLPLSSELLRAPSTELSKKTDVRWLPSLAFARSKPANPLPFLQRTACEKGLTFDRCKTDSACEGERTCVSLRRNSWGDPCQPTQQCGCMPPSLKTCSDSSQCGEKEVCALIFLMQTPVCVSRATARHVTWIEKIERVPESDKEIEPSAEPNFGLPLDECSSDEDCSEPYSCFYFPTSLRSESEPCDGRKECRCTTPDSFYRNCLSTGDCMENEMCAEIPRPLVQPHQIGACVSKNAGSVTGVTEIVVTEKNTGLTLESCAKYSDCHGDRFCIFFGPLRMDIACAEPYFAKPCLCIPINDFFCEDHSDCEDDEVCAGTPLSTRLMCVSKNAMKRYRVIKRAEKVKELPEGCPEETSEAGDPDDSVQPHSVGSASPAPQKPEKGACVDARALEDIDRKDLVFEQDIWAEVLCDRRGTCATDGHMVVYAGRSMMMKTFCKMTGCERKAMYVNSPRLRKGLRIGTRTEDLEFTAFAAMYSTGTEEAILSLAIRAGF